MTAEETIFHSCTINLDQKHGAERDNKMFQPTGIVECAVIPLMGGWTLRTAYKKIQLHN